MKILSENRVETKSYIRYMIHKNLWVDLFKNKEYKTKITRTFPLKKDQCFWVDSKLIEAKIAEWENHFDESSEIFVFAGRGRNELILTEEEGFRVRFALISIQNDIYKHNLLQEVAEMKKSNVVEFSDNDYEQLEMNFEENNGG